MLRHLDKDGVTGCYSHVVLVQFDPKPRDGGAQLIHAAGVHGPQLPVTSKDGGSCVPLILFSRRRSGNNSFNSVLKH